MAKPDIIDAETEAEIVNAYSSLYLDLLKIAEMKGHPLQRQAFELALDPSKPVRELPGESAEYARAISRAMVHKEVRGRVGTLIDLGRYFLLNIGQPAESRDDAEKEPVMRVKVVGPSHIKPEGLHAGLTQDQREFLQVKPGETIEIWSDGGVTLYGTFTVVKSSKELLSVPGAIMANGIDEGTRVLMRKPKIKK